MGYFFRCDVCHDEISVQEGEDFNHTRSCEDCGQDGCMNCMNGLVCDDCTRIRDANAGVDIIEEGDE